MRSIDCPRRIRIPLAAALVAASALACPAAAVAQPAASAPPPPSSATTPRNFAGLVKGHAAAVVAILTRMQMEQKVSASSLGKLLNRFYGVPQQRTVEAMALGSGFVISKDGYIVTASHVIANATDIHVKFSNGTTEVAKVVGDDPPTQTAVLKVKPIPNMAVVQWGDSKAVEPGDWVVAIGSPFGLGGTVTVGVLSARARDISGSILGGLLQTDASINHGNSGGPLFDAQGQVIGINEAILSPSGGNIGIGFAVPSATAEPIAKQLIATGKVERGYIGAEIQDVTPKLAQALNLSKATGALVASVKPGGPAAKAGIEPGVVVLRVGNATVSDSHDLVDIIANSKPGQTVQFTISRAGHQQTKPVTLGQQPVPANEPHIGAAQQQQPNQESGQLGIAVAPFEAKLRTSGQEIQGVVVRGVETGSPAAQAGLGSGDVIVSAGGKATHEPSQLAQAWTAARQSNRPLLLRVYHDGDFIYVAVG